MTLLIVSFDGLGHGEISSHRSKLVHKARHFSEVMSTGNEGSRSGPVLAAYCRECVCVSMRRVKPAPISAGLWPCSSASSLPRVAHPHRDPTTLRTRAVIPTVSSPPLRPQQQARHHEARPPIRRPPRYPACGRASLRDQGNHRGRNVRGERETGPGNPRKAAQRCRTDDTSVETMIRPPRRSPSANQQPCVVGGIAVMSAHESLIILVPVVASYLSSYVISYAPATNPRTDSAINCTAMAASKRPAMRASRQMPPSPSIRISAVEKRRTTEQHEMDDECANAIAR